MIKKILLGLLALVLLLVAVGLFLPRKASVRRSILINAPLAKVEPLVGDLKNWEKWSPWFKKDPAAVYEYSANSMGNGAWYTWNGKQVGEGKLTIMNTFPDGMVTKVEFKGMPESQGSWSFQGSGESTNVTWGFDTDLGMNPINRFFGLFMDRSVGPDFEAGLAGIKALAEADTSEIPPARPTPEEDEPVEEDSTTAEVENEIDATSEDQPADEAASAAEG